MSDAYTKLFSSITESTVWSEPAGTRLVWITMLAKCNRSGEVFGSVPGLARLANVSVGEAQTALETLLAPDQWSRTPDHEGRRIATIEGGWRLLNHAKYDRLKSDVEAQTRRAESKREWDRAHRAARPNAAYRDQITPDVPPTTPVPPPTQSVPPPALALDKSLKQDQEHVPQAARFADFWQAYPIKRGRRAALQKWKAKKLDASADALIADVRNRITNDRQWCDGFAPHAATYLNQERWEDELAGRKPIANATPRDVFVAKRRDPAELERVRKHGVVALGNLAAQLGFEKGEA